MKRQNRDGFSIIDLVISLAIIILLFGGIYLIYFSILDVINNSELRSEAASILESRVEVIRNMAYEDIGTEGGIPSGSISQEQAFSFGSTSFLINTTIRNIDDPFDGTLGGVPNDTAPADYKLVELQISCPDCTRFIPMILTTTVAPKNLESASEDGSLFVDVFDAYGMPISGVNVHVVNNNVTPTIDLIDATNSNGVLQLVGVPTSTQSYEIEVSLDGYSSERTYSPGDPENPNPKKPHATVAAQTVTEVSFEIDRLSEVALTTKDIVCSPIGDVDFSIQGTKLIGTGPDVYKLSTSSVTDGNGQKVFNSLEWDTYSFSLTDAGYDVLGTDPFLPLVVNPSSTYNLDFIVQSVDPRSLLITVKDSADGSLIPGASVVLSKTGFSETKITGRSSLEDTDWSGGEYFEKEGVDVDGNPGVMELELNASSTYTTSTVSWLVSNTLDFGSESSTFYDFSWTPTSQPPQTGSDSVKFQIASNNDELTWNFVGPGGSPSTYYTSSGEAIWEGHNDNQYLRYRAYLSTNNEFTTPTVEGVSIDFSGICVPQSQVLFTNLDLGDYDLDISAPLYVQATSSISITGDWQQQEILLDPQ